MLRIRDSRPAVKCPSPEKIVRSTSSCGAPAFGVIESFSCAPAGGPKPSQDDPDPANPENASGPNPNPRLPCFVQPASLWDHLQFPHLAKGFAPLRPNPTGTESTAGPATPPK